MASKRFDLFVIGGGSGGVRAARISAGHGARVGLCEHDRMGGTCVIRGCVPKKLLSYAAHFREDFEDAAGYGWTVPEPSFSWPDLIAAKDREIERLEGIYHRLLDNAGVETYSGHGRLLDAHTVQVGDEVFETDRILIATGGWPFVPEFPGSEHVFTSNEAFHLPDLPRRVVVAGGGYIACEFAGIFNGLGATVTQLYRGDALLRGFDRDVRASVTHEQGHKGIDVRLETVIRSIEKRESGLLLDLTDDTQIEVDGVMFATGRRPRTEGIGLECAGVEMGQNGAIVVDEYSQTSVEGVFAVGDVTDRINLTPVAIQEGHAFADTEFGGMRRPSDHVFVPSAVFSQPPVSTVGYTEEEAQSQFGGLRVYKSEFRPMKHTLSGREETMLMKLIVEDATDRVVGLHVVGPDAPEIVQGFAVALKSGLTKADFDATVGIHPTAAEELVTLRTPVTEQGAH